MYPLMQLMQPAIVVAAARATFRLAGRSEENGAPALGGKGTKRAKKRHEPAVGEADHVGPFGWKIQKLSREVPVMRPGASAGAEHFVIGLADLIIAEGRRHRAIGGLSGHRHIPRGRLNREPFDME
ncbi:MAG: hypothetical protein ABSH45_10655 [Bryobacteraceae bacterium]